MVYPAGGDNTLPAFHGVDHVLVLFLLFAGRHDDQQVKNSKNNDKWDQLDQHIALGCAIHINLLYKELKKSL
jgi:hypothetical protein